MAKALPSRRQDRLWRLEALAFDVFTALVRILPVDLVSALGGALGRWIGPLTSAHRTAVRNLEIALPELDAAGRARILRQQWDNFGRYLFEFPIADRLTPAGGRVTVTGFERLQAIARSGRPAVLISGHFANIEVMAAVILAAGIACDVTYRAANNPYVDRRIIEGRFRYGIQLLAPKGAEGARDLIASLKAGRSIAMLNDQRYDTGVAGPFFGQEVMTLPAGVRLAQRFGAVLQPMSIVRLKGARFRVEVHPPIPLTGDEAAGVAAINAFIEARVREHPGQWWWMHRRWPAQVYARPSA
ncbi:MAG: lysophospholipid acyltransferase family protein [Alphaproteobacteria bacterium]|nr:lysophospholipid acyltransferase family protein [Alphaproteobacteria bacterium]